MSERLKAALAYIPHPRTPQRVQQQPDWCEPYLKALAVCGRHTSAAQAVGLSYSTAHNYRYRHPEYEARCRAAMVRFERMRRG